MAVINLWSVQDYTRWHVATTPLPTGIPTIRFRVVVESDPFVNFEGVAIDDVHVYDNTMGVYDGVYNGLHLFLKIFQVVLHG